MPLTRSLQEALAKSTLKTVVNVSSLRSKLHTSNALAYNISKAALDKFTACASAELMQFGVRMNSVNPSAAETPLLEKFGFRSDVVKKNCEEKYPAKRIGQPVDVANAILFLASQQSAFIIGQNLVICGGKSICSA